MLALIMAALSFSANDLPTLEEVRAEKCRRHLDEFVRAAWPIIEPNTPLEWNWHLQAVCDVLEFVSTTDDPERRRAIINVPPGSGKSSIIAVLYPCWLWARDPSRRFMFVSHKAPLALRDSVRRRDILVSEWFQQSWPVKLKGDANLKSEFQNTSTGHMVSLGTGGSTGYRCDVLVMDDPNNATEMESDQQRESVLAWLDQMMPSRLNKDGIEIVIQQRTHEEDVTGHLLKRGGYLHLKIPMRYEGEPNPLPEIGYADPRSVDGELMWPAVYSAQRVDFMGRAMGSIARAAQFQQNPAPKGGAVFRMEFFRYFSIDRDWYILADPLREKRIEIRRCLHFQTVDTASKIKQENDWTVCTTFALTEFGDLLVLDVSRARLEIPDQFAFVKKMRSKFPAVRFQAVEDKNSGTGLIQEARRSSRPFKVLKADVDKKTRAIPVSIAYENGKVYHLASASWLSDAEHELLHFPVGAHDDIVDTISYAGIYAQTRTREAQPDRIKGRSRASVLDDLSVPAPEGLL